MDRTPCLGNTSAVRFFGRGRPLPDNDSNIWSDRSWPVARENLTLGIDPNPPATSGCFWAAGIRGSGRVGPHRVSKHPFDRLWTLIMQP